jgi:hypothetical protein
MIHHHTGVGRGIMVSLLLTDISTLQNVDEVDRAQFDYTHVRKLT